MNFIPPWILEGANGALAFALFWVLTFQISFLAAVAWRFETRDLRSFYRQMKPVIALTVAAAGLFVRFADIWGIRFSDHHGGVAPGSIISIFVHVFGTAAAVVGWLCWLRVTMPEFCGWRTWAIITILTAAVFIWPALV